MKTYNKFRLIAFLLIISSVSVLAQQKIKLVILHTNDTHSQYIKNETKKGNKIQSKLDGRIKID